MSDQILLPDLNNDSDVSTLLKNFFKGNQLDKETLRNFILEHFTIIHHKFELLIQLGDKQQFWNQVRDLAYISKQDIAISAINQIHSLPGHITHRIKENVDSPQAFELFIQLKAAEISSGDKMKDYFLAMKIRNDQLLACLYVYTQSITQLEFCISFLPSDVLQHPAFIYFGEKSIEDRIYEIAQKMYDSRVKLKLL